LSEANLISISQPSEYTGCSTAEELVAWVARVSNPSNQNNTATAPKLVKYLIRENHWSPLEMVHISIEIKTTRDIAHQMLRHVSFRFQEYSQRYADPTKDLGYTLREARLQDMKNRQNSVELSPDENRLADEWDVVQKSVINAADFAYKWATDRGIAKEQARAVLPEGCTKSTVIMAGTLRSWIHYCQLRRSNGTQKEHMIVADQCWDIIKQHFPGIEEALGA
jgi:thymidylate synthase (FAD)